MWMLPVKRHACPSISKGNTFIFKLGFGKKTHTHTVVMLVGKTTVLISPWGLLLARCHFQQLLPVSQSLLTGGRDGSNLM